MEKFDKIFGHSKKLFSRAREDGLITASLQWSISEMIAGLEASSLETRNCVYAFSQGPGVYAMNRELSKEINILIRDVERLRLLITMSAQQQLQLQNRWRSRRGKRVELV